MKLLLMWCYVQLLDPLLLHNSFILYIAAKGIVINGESFISIGYVWYVIFAVNSVMKIKTKWFHFVLSVQWCLQQDHNITDTMSSLFSRLIVRLDDGMTARFEDEDDFIIELQFNNHKGHFDLYIQYWLMDSLVVLFKQPLALPLMGVIDHILPLFLLRPLVFLDVLGNDTMEWLYKTFERIWAFLWFILYWQLFAAKTCEEAQECIGTSLSSFNLIHPTHCLASPTTAFFLFIITAVLI